MATAALATGVVALVAGLVTLAVPAAAATPLSRVRAIVDTVIPGATVALVAGTAPRGVDLQIELPAPLVGSSSGATGTSGVSGTEAMTAARLAQQFAAASEGWRAAMAAGVAAEVDRSLTSWSVTGTGITDRVARNSLHGYLRGRTGAPLVGAAASTHLASVAAVRKQVRSNLAVLDAQFPAGSLRSSYSLVTVDPHTHAVGVYVKVSVGKIADLSGRLGDVVDGMDAGLVDGGSSVVEGLAVTVRVAREPAVGSWQAALVGDGGLLFAPDVPVPGGGLAPSVKFPILTGGPVASATSFGGAGAGGASTGTATGSTKTAAASKPPRPTSGGGWELPAGLGLAAGLAVGSAGYLWLWHRRATRR